MIALARVRSSSDRIGRRGNRAFRPRNRPTSTVHACPGTVAGSARRVSPTAAPSVFFPVVTVVFLVGHHPTDVDLAFGIGELHDQAILVAADDEDDQAADGV